MLDRAYRYRIDLTDHLSGHMDISLGQTNVLLELVTAGFMSLSVLLRNSSILLFPPSTIFHRVRLRPSILNSSRV